MFFPPIKHLLEIEEEEKVDASERRTALVKPILEKPIEEDPELSGSLSDTERVDEVKLSNCYR